MPFNYKEYEQQCSQKTREQLHDDFQHYENVIAGASAGSGLAALTAPLTFGGSLLALGGTGPAIYNARKKRAIVQRHLERKIQPEVGPLFSSVPRERPQRPESQKHPFAAPAGRKRSVSSSSSSSQLPAYSPSSTHPAFRDEKKNSFDSISSGSESSFADSPPSYEMVNETGANFGASPGPPPPTPAAREYTSSRFVEHAH